jgi:hypothetical protein
MTTQADKVRDILFQSIKECVQKGLLDKNWAEVCRLQLEDCFDCMDEQELAPVRQNVQSDQFMDMLREIVESGSKGTLKV